MMRRRGRFSWASSRRHTLAYTLVELLIVITLLGIAAALVIPNMASADVLRVQAAVRAVIADISVAQSEALARQEGRAVMFSTDTNSYRVVEVRSATLNPETDTITLVEFDRGRYGDVRLISARFDGTNNLVFDALGGPVSAPLSTTPGQGGRIRLAGYGSTFDIIVEAYTGRLSVQRIEDP